MACRRYAGFRVRTTYCKLTILSFVVFTALFYLWISVSPSNDTGPVLTPKDVNKMVHGAPDPDGVTPGRELTPTRHTYSVYETLIGRRRLMEDNCRLITNNRKISNTAHLLVSTKFNFAFCYVPKVGCTFWKKLVYLLKQEGITPAMFKRVFPLLTKYFIHTARLPIANKATLGNNTRFLKYSTNILFTRHPYHRLFSAYVDKLVLPYLWDLTGKTIVQMYHRPKREQGQSCGWNVTFEEFLRYVIAVNSGSVQSYPQYDDHWTPIYDLCHPCELKYTFIGRLETFSTDRDVILHELGLSEFFGQRLHHEDPVLLSMNQTIDDLWMYVSTKLDCSEAPSPGDVIGRIWLSFQYLGYIPLNIHAPTNEYFLNKENFRRLAHESYLKFTRSQNEIRIRRRRVFERMFANVSSGVLKGIHEVFRNDFILFSYEDESIKNSSSFL